MAEEISVPYYLTIAGGGIFYRSAEVQSEYSTKFKELSIEISIFLLSISANFLEVLRWFPKSENSGIYIVHMKVTGFHLFCIYKIHLLSEYIFSSQLQNKDWKKLMPSEERQLVYRARDRRVATEDFCYFSAHWLFCTCSIIPCDHSFSFCVSLFS